MTVLDVAPAPMSPGTGDGGDEAHPFCGLCNEDRSLCGLDLSGVPEDPDGPDEFVCPLCLIVAEARRCSLECPGW